MLRMNRPDVASQRADRIPSVQKHSGGIGSLSSWANPNPAYQIACVFFIALVGVPVWRCPVALVLYLHPHARRPLQMS